MHVGKNQLKLSRVKWKSAVNLISYSIGVSKRIVRKYIVINCLLSLKKKKKMIYLNWVEK